MITSNVIETHFFVEQLTRKQQIFFFMNCPEVFCVFCLFHLHSNISCSLDENAAINHMFTVTCASFGEEIFKDSRKQLYCYGNVPILRSSLRKVF